MTQTSRFFSSHNGSLAICAALLLSTLASSVSGQNPDFASRFQAWQGGVRQASYDTSVLRQPEGSMPMETESAPSAAPAPRSTKTPAAPQRQLHYQDSAPMETWVSGNGSWDGNAMGCSDGCCGDSCGMGCNSCGGCGQRPYERCHSYCAPLWWAKIDALLWWRKGRDVIPLVTSDPSNEASGTAGVLPNAEVLYGPNSETTQMQAGAMFELGTWLDDCQSVGIGGRFWMLGRDSGSYDIDSSRQPVLAIPFFNVDLATNDTLLVAYPGLRTGNIDIKTSSEVFGADLYGKFLWSRSSCSRLDLIAGYQFARLNDELQIDALVVNADIADVNAVGSSTLVSDRFTARNQFHGGVLGAAWECTSGCWTLGISGKVALGSMHQIVGINGSSVFTDVAGNQQRTDTGLFAQGSNSGSYSQTDFCAVPEVNLSLGYNICKNTQLSIAYNFMFFSSVVRADDQIDPFLDTANDTRPEFEFETSAFWLQGLNLGVTYDF